MTPRAQVLAEIDSIPRINQGYVGYSIDESHAQKVDNEAYSRNIWILGQYSTSDILTEDLSVHFYCAYQGLTNTVM